MRFSLKQLMCAVGCFAIGLFCALAAYRHWLVPRIPIVWHLHTLADLEKDSNNTRRLVIVTGNWSISGSFGDIRGRLETARLRKFVARESIECWECDVTNDVGALAEVMTRLNIDYATPPFVIVADNNQHVMCPVANSSDLCGTRSCIERTLSSD